MRPLVALALACAVIAASPAASPAAPAPSLPTSSVQCDDGALDGAALEALLRRDGLAFSARCVRGDVRGDPATDPETVVVVFLPTQGTVGVLLAPVAVPVGDMPRGLRARTAVLALQASVSRAPRPGRGATAEPEADDPSGSPRLSLDVHSEFAGGGGMAMGVHSGLAITLAEGDVGARRGTLRLVPGLSTGERLTSGDGGLWPFAAGRLELEGTVEVGLGLAAGLTLGGGGGLAFDGDGTTPVGLLTAGGRLAAEIRPGLQLVMSPQALVTFGRGRASVGGLLGLGIRFDMGGR